MRSNPLLMVIVGLGAAAVPVAAMAQSVNVTRSILPDQPYTLIYPEAMIATGGAGGPLTINHPDAPLQCGLTIVPVEDDQWTADAALSSIDTASIAAAWAETFPGFMLGQSGTAQYQNATALIYEGTSESSPMGVPITLVHTETVSAGQGYSLDCIYSTSISKQLRPAVDFIIANFATRSDADCCVGASPVTEETPAQ